MAKKTDERKPIDKKDYQSKFMLIGEAKINDFTYKIDEVSGKSDWVYNMLNLGIDCGNGNIVYAEMMGGYGSERDNVLYVHGIKSDDKNKGQDDYDNKFTIAWEDRFDEDILETIGSQCFITVGIEKDKKGNVFQKKFLSAYDAIQYIKDNLEEGTVLNIKGNLKYSIYNDTVQLKKEITSVYLSKIDDSSKYKATFTQTVLLDKDSVGKLDKEKAVYPITVRVIDYTKMYNDKEVKQLVPFTKVFEFEVDKANPENTKKFIDKVLKVKKDITQITFEGDIVEGQSLATISEDDIPDDIKELIEIGAYTMEEAVGKLAVNGSREKRLIIRKPVIKMVGDEDDKKPVIMKELEKYKEEDLIFDFMFDDDNEDDDNKVESGNDVAPFDTDDEEDTSWLDALEEEE